jgi:ankyrin repeat protein
VSNATNQEKLSLLLAEYSNLPEFSGLECADVNSASLFGDKPIHIAATRGDINEIQLILSQGADINCKGEHGYTALHDAVEQGHRDAVDYLLKHGANPEALNDDGVSPAELAKLLDESEILVLLHEDDF